MSLVVTWGTAQRRSTEKCFRVKNTQTLRGRWLVSFNIKTFTMHDALIILEGGSIMIHSSIFMRIERKYFILGYPVCNV